MNRKFSLMLLTLALAGSLCACSNTTSEVTPTPDNSPMGAPEPRSGIVGYGYDGSGYNGYGYNNTDGGMWEANNGATWNMGDAARGAVNDVGNAARNAADDMSQGVNDMIRAAERSTNTAW